MRIFGRYYYDYMEFIQYITDWFTIPIRKLWRKIKRKMIWWIYISTGKIIKIEGKNAVY